MLSTLITLNNVFSRKYIKAFVLYGGQGVVMCPAALHSHHVTSWQQLNLSCKIAQLQPIMLPEQTTMEQSESGMNKYSDNEKEREKKKKEENETK